jgi:ubiquitin-conjugating enzyme E2 M
MQSDIEALDVPSYVKFELKDKDDLLNAIVTIVPPDGLWKKATFRFNYKVPDDYPFKPPKVTCLDKIYHPNIDLEGNVCLNLLRKDWKPILDTNAVVYGLMFLFNEPNPDDPLNQEAAAVLRQSKQTFARNVDRSLRGITVDGVHFPKNPTYRS